MIWRGNMQHSECRKYVCLTCFRKVSGNETIYNATELVKNRLEDKVFSNIDSLDDRLPVGLCSACRLKLRRVNPADNSTPFDFDQINKYLEEQKRVSTRSTACSCLVCQVAKSTGNEAKRLQSKYAVPRGRRPTTTTSSPIHRLCGICLAPIYRGCSHDKTQCGNVKYKLENVYNILSEGEKQQLAARVNREVAASSESQTFQLKTLGKPQTVTLGQPDVKKTQITHEDVDRIQEHANLTNTQVLKSE